MSLSSLGHHNSQSDPAPRPPTHSTVTFIRLHLLILSGSKSIFYPQIFFFSKSSEYAWVGGVHDVALFIAVKGACGAHAFLSRPQL